MADKNWLEKYIDYARKYTDAPIEFHRYIGLNILGSAIGDKAFFQFGDTTLYPNLWMVIIAPSSLFRKSTAITLCKNIFIRQFPERIYPNEFSIEKLLEIIKENRIGLFIHYEFITFMNMMNRDYMAGAKNLFTELFDVPETFIRKTRNMEIIITKPVISMLAATTMEWFLEQIKESDIEGGFLPRFLYIPAIIKSKSIVLPPKVDKDKKLELSIELKKIVDNINPNQDEGHCFDIDKGATELYEGWNEYYEKIILDERRRYKSFMVRHSSYLLKIAIIYQCLLDGNSPDITCEAMGLAIKDINSLGDKLKRLCEDEMAFTKDEKAKLKIKKIIEARKEGISQSEIGRRSGMLSNQLRQILDTLKEEKYILDSMVDTGGDKPTKIWKSIEK